MKRLMTLFFLSLALVACSVHYTEEPKSGISDELLEELAKDLVEINIMVENAGKEYKEEQKNMMVRVLEPWTPSPGLKYAIMTPSQRIEYDVLAKSRIEVPMAKDYALVDVFKARREQEKFIGVATPSGDIPGAEIYQALQMGIAKQSVVGGYPVKFYNAKLANDPKSFEAITKYISLTDRLEKTAKKILAKLVELKKKYEEWPIYIEGFTLSLPLIEVEIQFKFK